MSTPRWIKADPGDPTTWPHDCDAVVIAICAQGSAVTSRQFCTGRTAVRKLKAIYDPRSSSLYWMPWSAIGDPT